VPYRTRSSRGGSGFPSAGTSPSAVSRYCTLTSRIRLLADRYAAPLAQIVDEVEQLAAKVAAHLQKMGAY
jgi:hypothetical protein